MTENEQCKYWEGFWPWLQENAVTTTGFDSKGN